MMKKQQRWLLITIIWVGLVGCGLKGPLYSPPAVIQKVEKVKIATAHPDLARQ
ncbi:lipoprotein [Candidatus Fukatsuia symbiotica]|uniref:LPS translocon maturation chaperone LptM n=1 Tax=Candidatus Fukatsuia TaxID=1927833 RepID=UPI00093276AD|nr:lipoprotein [Candidatus Fukatsuia symbiotica]MEA9444342.1 lipoprotein [Candidatus Fukatsuia symbiotica]